MLRPYYDYATAVLRLCYGRIITTLRSYHDYAMVVFRLHYSRTTTTLCKLFCGIYCIMNCNGDYVHRKYDYLIICMYTYSTIHVCYMFSLRWASYLSVRVCVCVFVFNSCFLSCLGGHLAYFSKLIG